MTLFNSVIRVLQYAVSELILEFLGVGDISSMATPLELGDKK